jgi:hypothetical protein
VSLPALAERLSVTCGVTVILDRQLIEKHAAARNTTLDLPGQTVGQKLSALLGALHASVAWYDHALYVASAARIEALTQAERVVAAGPQLVGQPLNSYWVKALEELVIQQTYPTDQTALACPWLPGVRLRGDSVLAGRPVVARLSLDPNPADGLVLRYRTGVLGETAVVSLLDGLRGESAPAPGTAGLFSQLAPSGPIQDIETLAKQVQTPVRVELAPGLKPQPFSKHAFVNKSLRVGEALEWAAWLAGCGLRQESNQVWMVDEVSACYGPSALQVVSLAALEQNKALAPELPRLFARLLPELYPGFFDGVKFRCLGGRLVFTGDRRQLQFAQRLRTALEAGGPANAAEAQTWKPGWRVALEKNLAEPFQAQGMPKLSGSFVSLLRRGNFSPQLRCTVLVDPATMRDKGETAIADLDTTGLTVRQVLERLAKAAGLRVELDGDVIWLRP